MSHSYIVWSGRRWTAAVYLTTLAILGVCPSPSFGQPAPGTPDGLLKWSMSKYAALPTFQGDCTLTMSAGAQGSASNSRSIQYARPNRFKIVNKAAMTNATQTSVCDGTKAVEFMTNAPMAIPAQSYKAPESLAAAKTMYLGNPYFCGSLLYRFFGGPGSYAQLVNADKMPPAFGKPVVISGVSCKTVKFWAQGTYGSTEVAIGEKDGIVHQIVYHSEPLMEQARKMYQSPEFLAQMKKAGMKMDPKALSKMMPANMESKETYQNIKCGVPINPALFAAKAPAGQQSMDAGGADEPKPPVPLGQPAPEITVKGVDGSARKLSSLRGRVVLIDFWATWCPPCRKGLPDTQALHNRFGSKGLAVMTISDEPKATVTPYLKSNKLTMPAYLDQNGATNKAYHISAIPTLAIIDRTGKLSAYFVGLQESSTITTALKKAGLKVD